METIETPLKIMKHWRGSDGTLSEKDNTEGLVNRREDQIIRESKGKVNRISS